MAGTMMTDRWKSAALDSRILFHRGQFFRTAIFTPLLEGRVLPTCTTSLQLCCIETPLTLLDSCDARDFSEGWRYQQFIEKYRSGVYLGEDYPYNQHQQSAAFWQD